MKQILWFRRDLRINDSAILAHGKHEVLPIFIFDKNILSKLSKDDKRVTFLYQYVMRLKEDLKSIGLDLAIFYGETEAIFSRLKNGFDEVLCSAEFDQYSIQRDKNIEKIIPLKRYIDSFILDPSEHLKKDNKPYRVFTPFYKSLDFLISSKEIGYFKKINKLKKVIFDYDKILSLKDLGFETQKLPQFSQQSKKELFLSFLIKINSYQQNRDFFYKNATSNFSLFLRFGVISPREVFNYFKKVKGSDFFIKELFWREFYNYLLYHFPQTQTNNFRKIDINWSKNRKNFQHWCEGTTGIPIIDASMRYLNQTGLMPNRLRMINASFLTKNLLISWRWGEEYFAKKLLDYEISSNVGSWQWAASTGSDAVPYFRIFNPYTQSKKFDKNGVFIKSIFKEFENVNAKLFHEENGLQKVGLAYYPKSIIDIKVSREIALDRFKKAKKYS